MGVNMDLKQAAKYIDSESIKARDSATTAVEHALNAGVTLLEVKGDLPHGTFGDWLAKNVIINQIQANKYMRIGAHKAQVRAIVSASGEPQTINGLCEVLPPTSEAPEITEADASTLGYAGAMPKKGSRDSNDYHTPGEYVDAAREVMGSIDLDPFSTPEANVYIGADRFLTKADDAFVTNWAHPETRTVWMNPPYGRGIMTKAIERFLDRYEAGDFQQAVVLCNAATDTYWFHDMWRASAAFCLTRGRVAFIAGDKKLNGNTTGQVFFYFGPNLAKFKEVFAKHGGIVDARGYE